MYPRLLVYVNKMKENAEILREKLGNLGIEIVGVTKLFMGHPKVAKMYKDAGIKILGDSRIENINRMIEAGINGDFMMIRIPPLSRLKEMVDIVNWYLVSEEEVALAIDLMVDRPVHLIYMVDVGDLREGVMYDKAVEEIKRVRKKLKKARIAGVGTNIGCFGGVWPTNENLKLITDIAKAVDAEVVSVGGTIYLMAVEQNMILEGINQFRIGEAILLGTDITGGREIEYLKQETVILEAEVIEVKRKPSKPIGSMGYDAMGRKVKFEDLGERFRAIIAVGEQDISPYGLIPLDNGAKVVHASSDHTIVDVTDMERVVEVGDILRFKMNYSAVLRAVTSPYVEKVYIE
ncbi:MAG: alanine/ornithine racemase family PLP-dependent enzyme [Thermotogaceae bacterium]|nr:alanine/ornithine racemase family PLP-dependent enzyme [Thermotogaceae bacterium]